MEIKEVSLAKIRKDTVITPKRIEKRIINDTSITESTYKSPLKYVYEDDKLTIQLDKEYNRNQQYSVFIDYISKPNELKKVGGSQAITEDKGLYFINPDGKEKNKPKEIWTQGETQSNSVWMPTIDRPNERMTQEIYITVENKYVTLSNGELASTMDNGDGTRTDYWKMDLPHAPYLAMMAIGEFAVVKDKWRDKEVNYYVEKEYEPYAKAIFGNTPEMLEFFSNKLGVPFAWNKYSQVVVRDYVSGAMENTTATLHGEFMQRTDRELLDKTNEDVISHEMFHDWFGDLVTCESWSNVPLNESFATYGEYLWQEYKYGKDAADAHSAESRAGYLSEAQRKEVNLIRFQYDDREDMFDAHSYNKGGQVLHMLRKYVGDDAFFAALKLYLETNKFSSVEIHNLRLAFEKVTGEDLNWFFNQWFLSPGHPELLINEGYDASTKKVTVQIKQVQDFAKVSLFKLPMYIDIYVNGKANRKKITVTKADETFTFDEPTKPDLINVDAEKQLLCIKNEIKTNEEWAYQYRHAPLYLDRCEGLTELSKHPQDTIAMNIIIQALNDKFWGLRADAIEALRNIPEGKEKDLKEKLVKMAKGDEKSLVRAEALDYLILKYKDADLESVYKNALNDRAYSVLGQGLSGLAKSNPQEGLKIAKQYENEKSMDILFAIASLYAENGTDENNGFFLKSFDKFKGFAKIGFISQYISFLKSNKKDETVNSGVALFASIAKDENTIKWVAYYAKKATKDLYTLYEDKENNLRDNLKKLKETNPTASTQDLETQIAAAKAEKEKIGAVYDSLK
jgi:aminopeptidase N